MSTATVDDPRPAGRRGAWRRWLPLVLLLAAIEVTYVFFISAGTMIRWPTYSIYGDYLAEGFRSGHLYLSVSPPPALIAAKNPFDGVNARLWLWDASFHGTHYYLYWGPLPSLLVAGIKALFRLHLPVGDQFSVFVSSTIRLFAGGVLIDRIARRLYRGLPVSLVVLAILVFAYGNPTPWILARGAIYESAIAGGQACLVTGMLFAFEALWRREEGASPRPLLIAAGAAWALVPACRVSVMPAVAVLMLATAVLCGARGGGGWRRIAGDLVAISVPVVLVFIVLLLYNKARFESWFEFGIGQQLSTMNFRTQRSYIPADVYSYLLRPLRRLCLFPFAIAVWNIGAKGFPNGFHLQPGYSTSEPVAGVLHAFPWIWLGIPAALLVGHEWWRRLRGPTGGGLTQDERARVWCLVGFLAAATLPLVPVLALFIATMRYLEDIAAGMALLGTLGAFSLYFRVKERPFLRRSLLALLMVVGLYTVAIGLLLGFQGYYSHFRQHNPGLWNHLVGALSVCR